MPSINPVFAIMIILALSGCSVSTCEQYSLKRSESHFGDYVVTIHDSSEDDNLEEPSCFQILKDKSPLHSRRGAKFTIGSLYEEEKKESAIVIGADITGEGKPNLVISEYSGGAHCCLFFHIFEIGDEFRYIQTINLAHSDLADFKNLDLDPALELPMNDWTFAYWKTSFAASPAPKVVMKYSGRKYEMAPELMRKPALSPEELGETATKIRLLPEWKDSDMRIPVELWTEMLDLIYTGNMNQAWMLVDHAWPTELKGKKEFLDEFKTQLKTSEFWKEIEKMNDKNTPEGSSHDAKQK